MLKAKSYTSKGNKGTSVNLPKDFEEKVNDSLIAQAVRVYESNSHKGLSRTKSRGEVVASKRKIYKQKGTGKARHGALSAPIFVGGGRAHGPKGLKRELVLPKVMRKKALNMSLNLKAKDDLVVVVSGISDIKKTKEAATLLEKITKQYKEKINRYTVVLKGDERKAVLFFRNIEKVKIEFWPNLNAYKVLYGGLIVMDKKIFEKSKKVKK